MTNKASSFPNASAMPPLHRYGGVLISSPELPMHVMGDAYWVEGTGTVRALPGWPKGPPIHLYLIGNPTFVNSSKLLMPGSQTYTFSPGDSCWVLPLGDGVWRVLSISRADGIPYLPASKTLFPAPQGRLTLASGTPVTSSDVSGVGTAYWTPNEGDMIALYDQTTGTWIPIGFSETALSFSGATSGTNFDVFGYLDASRSFAIEKLAWTNDTTRATAIVQQDGIDVKSGDPTRRLLGTIRTIGTTGLTSDSVAFSFISNRYNPAPRALKVLEATTSWSYQTASFRQANGSTANQLDVVLCVPRMVAAEVTCLMSNSTTFGQLLPGIGIDSTTVDSSTTRVSSFNVSTTGIYNGRCNYSGMLSAGRHKIVWLENAVGVNGGTQTQYGSNTIAWQAGIIGMVMN